MVSALEKKTIVWLTDEVPTLAKLGLLAWNMAEFMGINGISGGQAWPT